MVIIMSNFNILDFKPVIINNFFTELEITEIQNIINNKIIDNVKNNLFEYNGFELNKGHGSFSYGQTRADEKIFSDNIHKKIKITIEQITKVDFNNPSISFQRYSLMSGQEPQLQAHTDQYNEKKFKEKSEPLSTYHIMSLSIPIKNNFNWDICINDNRYKIENNDALLFSATADIHRRPFRKFSIDEKYDVLIVRILPKNDLIDITKSKYENIALLKEKMYDIHRAEKKLSEYYNLKSGS